MGGKLSHSLGASVALAMERNVRTNDVKARVCMSLLSAIPRIIRYEVHLCTLAGIMAVPIDPTIPIVAKRSPALNGASAMSSSLGDAGLSENRTDDLRFTDFWEIFCALVSD